MGRNPYLRHVPVDRLHTRTVNPHQPKTPLTERFDLVGEPAVGHHHGLPGTTSINDLPRGQIHPHVVTHHAAHGIRTVTLQEGPNLRVAILRLFPPMHGHHRGQTQTSIRRGVADDRIKSKQRLPNRVRETHTPVPVRLEEMLPGRVLPAPGVTHKTYVHHVLSSRCGSTWVIQPGRGKCSPYSRRCLPPSVRSSRKYAEASSASASSPWSTPGRTTRVEASQPRSTASTAITPATMTSSTPVTPGT